jgi:hypothetical protein
VKLLGTARKKALRTLGKLSRRSIVTRLEENANLSNYQKAKEREAVASDQIFNAKASIADIATKMENDRREGVRKLNQAPEVSISTKTIHTTLHKDLKKL